MLKRALNLIGGPLQWLASLLPKLPRLVLPCVEVSPWHVLKCSPLELTQLTGTEVLTGRLTDMDIGLMLLLGLPHPLMVLEITCIHRLKLMFLTRLDRLLFSRPLALCSLKLPTVMLKLELRVAPRVTAVSWLRDRLATGPDRLHRKQVQVCLWLWFIWLCNRRSRSRLNWLVRLMTSAPVPETLRLALTTAAYMSILTL